MAKKKKSIQIDDSFVDTCLWASTRYFIGRHTIAAHYHASDIAKFLSANSEIISQNRRKFLAKDIRSEITDRLRFQNNIHITGFPTTIDALSVLCLWIDNHLKQNDLKIELNSEAEELPGKFNPSCHEWYIDFEKMVVTMSPLAPEHAKCKMNFRELLSDMDVWIKLAEYLDPHNVVTINSNFENPDEPIPQVFECIQYPTYGRYEGDDFDHLHMAYCSLEKYADNPFVNAYFDPSLIISIKQK